MKIQDVITYGNLDELVEKLENSREKSSLDIVKELKKEWNIAEHRVMVDKTFLPDKNIKNKRGEIVNKKHVNRIALPYQKMIVERTIAFGFSNDVGIEVPKEQEEKYSELIQAVKRVLYENKETTFNKKVARDLYRGKEVGEIWYVTREDKPHKRYGFSTPFTIGVMHISGWNDNSLYTIFDDYGNLKLFARQYVANVGGDKLPTIQIWTDEEELKIQKEKSGWKVIEQKTNIFKKIPIIYARQEMAEWEDVKHDIERLELLLSRHAEINDYHASPKTFVKGNLKSMPQAGEANGVINGEADSDVQILSWKDSPESIKLEIETRLENIHKFTQIPDISFKSVKALNQVSGVMLKMLFMDAHLKVMAKNEIWEEYFTRRYNVIKSILSVINPASDWSDNYTNIEMTPIIKPYMIQDTKEMVEIAMTANGNKPIIDREGSIRFGGLVKDVENTLTQIIKEEEEEFYQSSSEPQNY